VSLEAQFLAVLMEQDSFFTDYSLRKELKEAFPTFSDEEYNAIFRDFESDGTLIAFDLENDGLVGESFDHDDHGQIEAQELSLLSGGTYFYSLGTAFPIRLHSQRSAVLQAALDGGLSEAARLLSNLPFDASTWTGRVEKLSFDAKAKSKFVALIKEARSCLDAAELNNLEYSKASAYLDCALLLAEQPEPDADLLAELVRRAIQLIGALSLMADLKSLFWN